MNKFLALITAMAVAIGGHPVVAQDNHEDGFKGVYEGTIGRYPIVACFDTRHDGDGFGSYYYLSQLKPIPLAADQTMARWSEGSVFTFSDKQDEPIWSLRWTGAENASGTWRNGKRTYSIKLTRIPDAAEDYEAACGAANFLGPRVGKATFTRTQATLGSFGYTIKEFQTPAHFEEVSITGFTFEPSEPGDSAIIAKLSAMLPTGNTQDEFVQCLAGNLAWTGVDGDFSQASSPRFVNEQLLSFEITNGSYCGGAHPNYWQEYFLFDRQSGQEIDPFRWFNPTGLKESDYGAKLMEPPLRDAIMERWPTDGEPECRSEVQGHEFWRFQLLDGGISFQPDLPHIMTVCEEQVFLSWKEVDPFLSEEGKMIRKRAEL